MTLYKVAAYADEEYTMTEEFQGCGITTKQLLEAKNVSQITETLEKYVAAQKLKGIQKTKKAKSTGKSTDIFQSIWDAVFMKDFMWEKTPIFQIQTV